MMASARSSSPELGQFSARYSTKSLRTQRIATQSPAIGSTLAAINPAPYA